MPTSPLLPTLRTMDSTDAPLRIPLRRLLSRVRVAPPHGHVDREGRLPFVRRAVDTDTVRLCRLDYGSIRRIGPGPRHGRRRLRQRRLLWRSMRLALRRAREREKDYALPPYLFLSSFAPTTRPANSMVVITAMSSVASKKKRCGNMISR